MSTGSAPRRGLASRLLRLLGGALRMLVRPFGLGLFAVLLALARGLAGPRYRPPHTPQNPSAEVTPTSSTSPRPRSCTSLPPPG